MSKPWLPEQIVSPFLALTLIQEQFPQLQAREISLVGSGWDNTAYLIDRKWIFRFPRRQTAVHLLETESIALPELAKRLPIPIPNPRWIGKPSESYSWPFIGYSQVPGITACQLNLSSEERSALAIPIAKFLKTLHGLPATMLAKCATDSHQLGRINPPEIKRKIEEVFAQLEDLQVLEHRAELEGIVHQSQTLPTPELSTLVHGDFYVRHILLTENRALSGVIDWGDMHIGHPAIDLAFAHAFFPKNALEIFRQAYGQISAQTWQLAKLRAIYSSANLLFFGHHIEDIHLIREGSGSLKRIALS